MEYHSALYGTNPYGFLSGGVGATLLAEPSYKIPRGLYAAIMVCGVALSVILGVAIAAQQEGAAGTLLSIGIALGLCGSIALVALVGPPLVTTERFGLVVLGSTAARTMVSVLLILVLTQVQGLAKRPVAYGVMSGTFVLLIIEAAAAVWLLARIDRARVLRVELHSNQNGKPPATVVGVSDGSRA